jgi:branched-chain amino acid transport system permease protein
MIQLLVTTLSNAAIYALVAVSLNVIYRSSGVLNFGAGHMLAFAGIVYVNVMPANVLGIAGSLVGGGLVGLVAYAVAVWWGQRSGFDVASLSLALLGFGLLLEYAAAQLWGVKGFSAQPILSGTLTVGDTTFAKDRLTVVLIAAVFIVAVVLFVEKTMAGHALEATAADSELAGLYGVRTGLAACAAWAIAGSAVGLTGALQSTMAAMSMANALPLVILGTAAAVVGGLGSIQNAVIGAVAVAFLQAAFTLYVSPAFTLTLVFVLLFVVLAVRPHGLFANARTAERV